MSPVDLGNLDEVIKSTLPPSIDLGKIAEIVGQIIAVAPAIAKGIGDATPFVQAIAEMIAKQGNPSNAEWDALRARLDAGSRTLQLAATAQSGTTKPLAGVAKSTVADASSPADIKTAQQRLLALGYTEVGTADGVMGEATKKALALFQTDNGMVVSAKVDEELLEALEVAGPRTKAKPPTPPPAKSTK